MQTFLLFFFSNIDRLKSCVSEKMGNICGGTAQTEQKKVISLITKPWTDYIICDPS